MRLKETDAVMKMKPLSSDEIEARKPPPPDDLVNVLNDRIHVDIGRARVAKAIRVRKNEKKGGTMTFRELLHKALASGNAGVGFELLFLLPDDDEISVKNVRYEKDGETMLLKAEIEKTGLGPIDISFAVLREVP